jgi:DNA-binding MarR family transcriptional regulator
MAKRESKRHEETKLSLQLMKRILLHFRAQMNDKLRPSGVTTAQLQVLFAVRDAPGSSGAQLARCCYMTPQSAQAQVKQLERRGFIVRGKDKVNDRIVTTSITPVGERLMESVEKISRMLQSELWKGVSDDELVQCNELLGRCLKNLGEALEPQPCGPNSRR